MRIRTFFLGLLVLIAPVHLLIPQEAEEFPRETKQLEWAPVEGALFYLVDIESEGVIIHSIKTEDAFLPLFLNPGEYRVRISVFNKFEKMASMSDWSDLTIYPSPQPIIREYSPDFFYDDSTSITIEIGGKDFDRNCRFILINGTDRITGEEVMRLDGEDYTECTVTFSDSRLPEIGLWDLAVVNPSQKRFLYESAIRFGPRTKPIIHSMNPFRLYVNENPGEIVIKGEHFSNNATLRFDGPSPVSYSHLEIFYGEELTFLLDTDSMSEGTYRIYIINEKDEMSLPYVFTLEARPLEKAEEIQQIRESEDSPSFFLGLNYHMSHPMDSSSILFENSFLGAGLTFRKKFKNDGVYRIPVLREAGFTFSFDYSHYEDSFTSYLTLNQFLGEGGLFYLSEWDFPVNIYLGMGFGASYSFFYFEDGTSETSLDLTNRLQGALQFVIKGIKFEAGGYFMVTHFAYNTMTALNPYLMAGRSW